MVEFAAFDDGIDGSFDVVHLPWSNVRVWGISRGVSTADRHVFLFRVERTLGKTSKSLENS